MKNIWGKLFGNKFMVDGKVTELDTEVINDYIRDYDTQFEAEDRAVERYCSRSWSRPDCGIYDEHNYEMKEGYEKALLDMTMWELGSTTIKEDDRGNLYPALTPPIYKYAMKITYRIKDIEYTIDHSIISQWSRDISEAHVYVNDKHPETPIRVMV